MGMNKREAPARLAEKLLALRMVLGVSQSGMYAVLHPDQIEFARGRAAMIYAYEQGKRIPSLLELKSYVKAVQEKCKFRIMVDDLLDDEVNLWF